MMLHLLRMMWKAKKRNALLAFQLFVGFLLIFVLMAMSTHQLKKYLYPLGFQYKNLWYVQASVYPSEKIEQLIKQLKTVRGISVSFIVHGAVPYFSASSTASAEDYMGTGRKVSWEIMSVDLAYKDVMGLTITEGRWFNETDLSLGIREVISPALRKAAYHINDTIKPLASQQVGVLENFCLHGEFEGETSVSLELLNGVPKWSSGSFLLKVPEGSGIELEEKLDKIVRSLGGQTKITRIEDQRAAYLKKKLAPLFVVAGVGIFLFINVILGLFGVLWYSISQRVSEIGLRRAVGATATNISFQFVSEMLILASMGIIPGIIVAAQIQIFNLLKTDFGVYLLSMALTTVLIYVLVSLCALIPVVKSAKMKPAEALAEE